MKMLTSYHIAEHLISYTVDTLLLSLLSLLYHSILYQYILVKAYDSALIFFTA